MGNAKSGRWEYHECPDWHKAATQLNHVAINAGFRYAHTSN